MTRRLLVLIGLVAIAGLVRWQTEATPVIEAAPLEDVPFTVGAWHGRPGAAFTSDVVSALGVDDYINRAYALDAARQANVYVGYHRSQHQGAAIHSPLNCMPGSGWTMDLVERVAFGDGYVRRVIIRKGRERLLVVYWYQTQARIEGEEYRARLHAVIDTLRARRNDAALVRVTVPIARDPEGEVRAAAQAFELAALIEPQVQRLLFSSDRPATVARVD